MDPNAQKVIDFWLGDVGPSGWYAVDPALDDKIRGKFGSDWKAARSGAFDHWAGEPRSCLALLILLDQFPRNMFRGSADAFATDAQALAIAKDAIAAGHDELIALPERQFFYLPLMHAEALVDQDACVKLIAVGFGAGDNLTHARAHREVIRRFGRFPHRNEALGRETTAEEAAFLQGGGYPALVKDFAAQEDPQLG
jgi:uncharacterized protein (DUF924 family)